MRNAFASARHTHTHTHTCQWQLKLTDQNSKKNPFPGVKPLYNTKLIREKICVTKERNRGTAVNWKKKLSIDFKKPQIPAHTTFNFNR